MKCPNLDGRRSRLRRFRALVIVPLNNHHFSFHEERLNGYRYEAQTIEGCLQQVAVHYVARGYYFYVSGIVPEGKDPRAIAEKLIGKYGIAVSKFVRARRKLAGQANLQLILHGRIFLLL